MLYGIGSTESGLITVARIGALYRSLVFDSAVFSMAKLQPTLSSALIGISIADAGSDESTATTTGGLRVALTDHERHLVALTLDTLLGLVRRCGRAAHDCLCAFVRLAVGPNAQQLRDMRSHGRHPPPLNPPSAHSHTIASQVRSCTNTCKLKWHHIRMSSSLDNMNSKTIITT